MDHTCSSLLTVVAAGATGPTPPTGVGLLSQGANNQNRQMQHAVYKHSELLCEHCL